MAVEDPERALLALAEVLDRLEIPYAVGGSLASSRFGEPRATNDVDVLVAIGAVKTKALVAALRPDFHLDEASAIEAAMGGRSFSAVHRLLMGKFDLFVAWDARPLDARILERRQAVRLDPASDRTVWFTSAEDIVLQKLEWLRRSGGILERQMRDVKGVLKVQGRALDLAYLRDNAHRFGLADLLERALVESGLGD